MLSDQINNIFPNEDSIPAQYRLKEFVDQREYLINGEIHHWQGPMQEVLSPICVKTADGIKQQVIGQYPLLSEKEAVAALDAATAAYNHGRGKWPTMSVPDRIKHMEEFVYRMKEQRAEVVNLLMWRSA